MCPCYDCDVATGHRQTTVNNCDLDGWPSVTPPGRPYPIIYNSRFSSRRGHWCGYSATFPERIVRITSGYFLPEELNGLFGKCAKLRSDVVTTTFWTSSWLPRNESSGALLVESNLFERKDLHRPSGVRALPT